MPPRLFYAGCSVRVRPDLVDLGWDEPTRRMYLLRTDVACPLSADARIWDDDGGPDGRSIEGLPWESIDDIRALFDARGGRDRHRWVIVVLGVVAEDADEVVRLGVNLPVHDEMEIDAAWTFVGYDVVDNPGEGISGLCDCGYDAADASLVPQAEWAPRLNEHGLFGRVEDALAFRPLCERRVVEHAPFFVVGVWVVGWP